MEIKKERKKKSSNAKQEVHKPLIPLRDGENIQKVPSPLWKVVFDTKKLLICCLKSISHMLAHAQPFLFKLYFIFIKISNYFLINLILKKL